MVSASGRHLVDMGLFGFRMSPRHVIDSLKLVDK
jgi:hypothetical protein